MYPTSCSRHCRNREYHPSQITLMHTPAQPTCRISLRCSPRTYGKSWGCKTQSTAQQVPAYAGALDTCKSIMQAADQTNLPPSMASSTLPSQGTALNVWAEHAPPRLDSEAVSKLIEKFKQNYPSEHLDSDTRPSIRLLSLVHQWFRPHGAIKWVQHVLKDIPRADRGTHCTYPPHRGTTHQQCTFSMRHRR